MLTDTDRERLRHEEIFRAEVRSSLERPSSAGQRMWRLLNSAFGLWVLSSVVLAFVTWSYSHWQASATNEANRRALIGRIDTEIAGRLRNGEALVRTAQTKEQLYVALVAINGGAEHINFDFGVFPEFRRRSLQSLLYELQGANKEGATSLGPALRASLEMQTVLTEAINTIEGTGSSEKPTDASEKGRMEALLREFSTGRWPR